MQMFNFWKQRRPVVRPPVRMKTPSIVVAKTSPETATKRRRLADTDGTLRRMRQTVENNRLL
jgi:hypothetical protein